jgi:uncharacterized membrane protein
VFDSLFQLLFQYRPVVFSQGELRFAASSGSYVAALLAVAAVAVTIATYRTTGRKLRRRDRAVLAVLRVAMLSLVVFCLFQPVLIVKAAVPQQNFVAVLLDDSRSMTIADMNKQPRGTFLRQEFGAPDRGVLGTLSQRFLVRTFRFSSFASRLEDEDDLTFAGAQTHLGAALDGARQELAGLPLAGIVMVSDGADTTAGGIAEPLLALKSQGVPVFTVGVGRETLERDIQIGRVSTPRTALKGTTLLVDVVLTQTGYAGKTVNVDVEDEGRIAGTQTVKLPDDGSAATARVRFTVSEPGPRVLRFRVAPQDGELVTENNARDSLIDVRDRSEKILYFEGEPRAEMKFLRRAVSGDKNLMVVALQRTAENKYMRINVDSGEELAAAFPKTREELFAYRGLILGSIEAGAFSGDQMKMISEFVDRRGGGLLMLGGARSFGEGGYAGTSIADVLPVVLDPSSRDQAPAFTHLKVQTTRAGVSHAISQIAENEAESAEKWNFLRGLEPGVTTVNRIDTIKPGATTLLAGIDDSRRERPVLAFQRYGRGKSLALTLQDSWQWQMAAPISEDDMTHEHFWRQLLRWLVDGVPDAVEVQPTTDRVEPSESATLRADIVDASFVELNDAAVTAHVAGPDGNVVDIPMQWSGERSGEYRATLPTSAQGWYEAKIDATRGGKTIGTAVTHLRAAPGDAEYFDATMHAATLKRVADETGGRFYTPETIQGLAEDLKYTGRGVTSVEERDLWHLPIVLMLLVGLLCAEWGYRRAVGLS